MACNNPIKAWYNKEVNEKTGKRSLVFNQSNAIDDLAIKIPCNQCMQCRIDRKRDASLRMMHENQMHESSIFGTFTLDDQHLEGRKDKDGNIVNKYSINKRDMQLFIKRLRNRYPENNIRYVTCGEYGDTTLRPHYHAIIYGIEFEDKKVLGKNSRGDMRYKSEILEEAWGLGLTEFGTVTQESCNYVANYVTKKINGEMAEEHYQRVDEMTGEVHQVQPEFKLQSTRPAIGKTWYEKYKRDLDKDFITTEGQMRKIPKYYDKLRTREDDIKMDEVKDKRETRGQERSLKYPEEYTPERLKNKEEFLKLKFKKKELEKGKL